MSQISIHFDEATLKAIDRIAPAAKRKRADFIRQAVQIWELPEKWEEERD
jgi:metal-responsive CopG/Arc/MetJ family transcriptional regulator